MLCVLETGCWWRDMPAKYGHPMTPRLGSGGASADRRICASSITISKRHVWLEKRITTQHFV